MADNTDDVVARLVAVIGLTEKKAKESASNKTLTKKLLACIDESKVDESDKDALAIFAKEVGPLVYMVASKVKDKETEHRPLLLSYVVSKKIDNLRLPMAIKFFEKLPRGTPFDAAAFEKECGVGVVVGPEEVKEEITAFLADPKNKATLETKRYQALGPFLGALKSTGNVRFADGKVVKDEIDSQFLEILGDRKLPINQPKRAEKPKKTNTVSKKDSKAAEEEKLLKKLDSVHLHDPKDNKQATPELMAEHLKVTGGAVWTRFPPEPNGYLHLGHAKSMNLNFGYANKKGGKCYLRFDDTNPITEEHEYINHILEIVSWLGHSPWKVTYSSDHFDWLYENAVRLIKADKAFVCHQPKQEMQDDRRNSVESKWRNRPIAESLAEFEKMKNGEYEAGEAVLRMKMDMKHPNPNMRDLVAYRVLKHAHPRSGDKWVIYPTYDYTHCLIDSRENITHSLCSLEFQVRQDSYKWLVHASNVYAAPQIEFSRLNVTNNVMSKRKLITLVENNVVDGWSDPRLLTLAGLRRRGYSPAAINEFCDRVGISRTENLQELSLLDQCVREDLDLKAPRGLAVLNPLKVTLTNYPTDKVEMVEANDFPADPSRGKHTIPFQHVLYIDRDDFRETPEKNYKRLVTGGSVGLKYGYPITCTEVVKDDNGDVVEIKAEVDLERKLKPKGYIQWVAGDAIGSEPTRAEVRLYELLFKSAEPAKLDNYLKDVRSGTKTVVENAMVDASIVALASKAVKEINEEECYAEGKLVSPAHAGKIALAVVQFERVGFFVVDEDSLRKGDASGSSIGNGKLVFNRTVTLLDTYGKKKGK
eukprot:TRINITY_DN926_c3_g1_i1.p1 TRINITY_DN926_c3_g1~~TRINITY_DN926_c3_g1_i1.p1  ORF type:complete len:839 (+),score=277.37 TRINITY_DN926_c3_g1_i1:69-2519(+)